MTEFSIAREANRVEAGDGSVVILGAFFKCTKCGELKEAIHFGTKLRKMADGTYRNQAQCSSCR